MMRRGMTLVEMLVALTATLIMMAAIAQVFSAFGMAINTSRSVLDLDGQMRTVAWRLRSDLAGVTARMLPPLSPEAGDGYFEVIEGPNTDHLIYSYARTSSGSMTYKAAPAWPTPFNTTGTAAGPGSSSDDRLLGDCDDVLLFTTRSTDAAFVGQAPGNAVFESNLAEVGWFARATPGTSNPVTYTLYRRQMLVMGYIGAPPFSTGTAPTNTLAFSSWSGYFNQPCDVSVRRENNTLYPNTLADLTRRESRFLHNPSGTTTVTGFPFAFLAHQTASTSSTTETLPASVDGLIFDSTSARQGEDVVLTNVIAFDVRVFDPAAPIAATTNGTPLVPGDPGFTNTPVACGGFVDLGYTASGTTAGQNRARMYNALLGSPPSVIAIPHFSGPEHDVRSIATPTRDKSQLLGADPHLRLIAQDLGVPWLLVVPANPNVVRKTYCTWSTHYEANGRNEDGFAGTDSLDNDGDGLIDALDLDELYEDEGVNKVDDDGDSDIDNIEEKIVDQGTNGIDDDRDGKIDEPPYDADGNGVYTDTGDDLGEMETSPPYPYPLRGIEVRIRCYEPSSKQVRQVTVRQTFVPQ